MCAYFDQKYSRRDTLRTAGVLLTGCGGLTTLGVDSTRAQDADASIAIEDQESDGESVVVASARTSIDARLIIISNTKNEQGFNTLYRELRLDAGTDFTNRTIELDREIEETRTIRAEIRTVDGNDDLLARDRALVAVGESLSSVGSAIRLPNGQARIIEPDRDAGFHLPYLLYKPGTRTNTVRPLFVLPHNSPSASSRDELRDQVKQAARGPLFRPAVDLRLPGLIPAFPRLPDDGLDLVQSLALPTFRSDNYLEEIATADFPADSLRRVDEQLASMLDDARERLAADGYSLSDRIHMNGFSASGQFSSRFAFLYPDRVGSISIGGNGAYPLPRESMDGTSLPYPLGTADYRTITGREFDRGRWTEIDQFIFVGQEDQPLPGTDSTGYYSISDRHAEKAVSVFGQNRVTERLPVTESVYQSVGATATFRVYEGVGHTMTQDMTADYLEFHRETSGAPHAMVDLTVRRSADRVAVGEPLTVTVQVQSRVSTATTVPVRLSLAGTEIETTETQVPAEGTAAVRFDHSFDEPGSYTFVVNGMPVGEEPVVVTEPTPTPSPTPTETATPTATPAATPTATVTPGGDESSGESGPGFGTGVGIAGLTGAAYLLKRRVERTE